MKLIEVLLPDGRWVPMIPARQQGLPYHEARVAPCVISLLVALIKLGLVTPLKDVQIL